MMMMMTMMKTSRPRHRDTAGHVPPVEMSDIHKEAAYVDSERSEPTEEANSWRTARESGQATGAACGARQGPDRQTRKRTTGSR